MVRREYPEAPVVGVGAVVLWNGRVLLVRRGQEPLKGEWSLPGGALELGETLEEGIVREVLEESGLSVRPVGIVEVFDKIVHDEESGRIRYHYVLVDFLCVLADDTAGDALRCGSDAQDACWAEKSQLSPSSIYQLAPFTVQVIDKALGMHDSSFRRG